MDAVYLDAALGLRVADDRLQNLIDRASDGRSATYKPIDSLNVTIGDIRAVQHKTSTLADLATVRLVGQREANKSQTLARGLLSKGLWKDPPIAAGAFRARTSDDEPVLAAPDVIERVSDECIQQLFAGHNCGQLNDTLGHGQPPPDWNLASKCVRVADNAQLIVDENFPLPLRDLFMEQVAVCGFMDLPVFKNPSAMKDVLSWQRDDGCFVIEKETSARTLPQPVKREERKGKSKHGVNGSSP
ncbi:hypothetical protein HPB50_015726 [Hyalomma asiaticum]|uniref:Uncharacterized protein n=1 Tax=Hyalomma asiaticum TaxID=266040 RepID=A0ACB7T2F4_HYAAI|nr:hypothetical protein HPB50_015726 [Hyalomma asiaticum]